MLSLLFGTMAHDVSVFAALSHINVIIGAWSFAIGHHAPIRTDIAVIWIFTADVRCELTAAILIHVAGAIGADCPSALARDP